MSFYRFKEISKGRYTLKTFELNHSHEGKDISDLTESMKNDLIYISKSQSISSIVDFLEAKYNISKLNYQKVYYAFRKVKPLFGADDCEHFHSYLKEKNFFVESMLNGYNESLCKLFFASPTMQYNYNLFGDIILIDATYNTNIYKVPLVVITGIGCDGRNLVFGMAFVNDETLETYEWIFKAFLSAHKKPPNLIVSDGDPAICSTIASLCKDHPETNHFICQWHLKRNLKRHFSFLKRQNRKEYETLMSLPHIDEQEQFELVFNSLLDFFKSNESYKKAQNYMENLYKNKEKWADSCKPTIFTAGTNTTSRAESMNKHIKRYMDSSKELSEAINLIMDLDKSSAFSFPAENIDLKRDFVSDLIMKNLKDEMGDVIYKMNLFTILIIQFLL